jgi:hypothetical protein
MKKIVTLMLLAVVTVTNAQQKNKTQNVILITLDGFRWQEVFNGADSVLMKQQEHLKDSDCKRKYWHDNLQERRKLLLPFFWGTLEKQGQLYGNRAFGNKVNVTNKMWFSYPGYNEILTGKADDINIRSNDKFYNPNPNVLEFINNQKGFEGKVAAFTSWDVFPFILNDKRNGLMVSTGWNAVKDNKLSEREKMMNDLITALPNPLGDVRLDAFTFYYGIEYLKENKPRVLYFAFDETDDFAHGGEYAAYLNAAHYTDRFISELWNYLQSDPQYKDKTTLLLTCDHGRGNNKEDWKHHGEKIAEADQVWFAVIGPDTRPLGEVKEVMQLYQNQTAKTLAGFLGLDYNVQQQAGEAVGNMLNTKSQSR